LSLIGHDFSSLHSKVFSCVRAKFFHAIERRRWALFRRWVSVRGAINLLRLAQFHVTLESTAADRFVRHAARLRRRVGIDHIGNERLRAGRGDCRGSASFIFSLVCHDVHF
jgi:hypothetical protein